MGEVTRASGTATAIATINICPIIPQPPPCLEGFGVVGERLRAFDSGRTYGAHEVILREYQRFEGVSEPDDMAILYAIESADGTRGSLVDAFGAYSNPTVSAFLHDVPIGTT